MIWSDDWSDRDIEDFANGQLGLSPRKRAERQKLLCDRWSSLQEQHLMEMRVPPYVISALRDGDWNTVNRFANRSGAEYEFGKWLDREMTWQRISEKLNHLYIYVDERVNNAKTA